MNLVCSKCRLPHVNDTCGCSKGVAACETLEPARDAEATIRSTAARTRMRLMRLVMDNERWDRIVELGVTRATNEGALVYGDTSYYKSDDALEYEGDCELADWTFYAGVIVERSE